jgi:hypothetical protein
MAAVSVLCTALAAAFARDARAQDQPYRLGGDALVFGGELAGVLGPRDAEAFFNYTDYERNALRTARLRFFSEWRVRAGLSVLGELRAEDGPRVEAAALFLRWRPWADREFDVQVGRIPPVVGLFTRQAYGRNNLVIGVPLAYQYLTSLRPDALPATVEDLLRMRGRGWQPSFPIGSKTVGTGIPIISAARWDTGVQARWSREWLEVMGAWSRGSPAVPVIRETNGGSTWSGRAIVRLPVGLTLGASGARGQWVERSALDLVPEIHRRRSTQALAGVDAELGLGSWLLRGEILRVTFDVPVAPPFDGRLPLWSSYGEARYRFHPRWQVAARAGRLDFGRVLPTPATGSLTPWDASVSRLEGTIGFRAHRQVDIRAGWQHNWRDGGRVRERGFPALQVLVWF